MSQNCNSPSTAALYCRPKTGSPYTFLHLPCIDTDQSLLLELFAHSMHARRGINESACTLNQRAALHGTAGACRLPVSQQNPSGQSSDVEHGHALHVPAPAVHRHRPKACYWSFLRTACMHAAALMKVRAPWISERHGRAQRAHTGYLYRSKIRLGNRATWRTDRTSHQPHNHQQRFHWRKGRHSRLEQSLGTATRRRSTRRHTPNNQSRLGCRRHQTAQARTDR